MPAALQWLAVDLLTGHIICELPSITSEDPFRRTIGQYETSNAVLTVPSDGSIDPEWERGILEGASALVAYTGDPGSEIVQWGGVVLEAPRSLGNTVQLSLGTIEVYLDGRFTGEYTTDPGASGATAPQNQICADVVTLFAADTGGLPITVVQLPDPPGVTGNTARLLSYHDYDDVTVYGNLQNLAGLTGGPEWTMHWVWNHAVTPNTITPYFYVGTRVGAPATSGLGPTVTFDETVCQSAFLARSYAKGKGANVVTAVAPGNGLGRVQATATAPANGRPKWEYRWTPASNSYDLDTMTAFAQQTAASIGGGTQALALAVQNQLESMRFGVDWNLGDDIGYSIQSLNIPNRITGVVRCIGYESTDTTVTPVLATLGTLA